MFQVINVDEFCEAMQAQVEVAEIFKQWSGTDYNIWSKVFDYLEQYNDNYEFVASDVYEAVSIYDGIADFDSHHPHDYDTCQICSNLEEGEALEPEDFIQQHLELYPISSDLIKVKDYDSFYVVIEHDRL